MKIVVQRCLKSSVIVDGELVSNIDRGMNLLVCLEKGDCEKQVIAAAEKILNLRIFADENNRMNKNISQIAGKILAVSQFTLSWDGRKGNRPSFDLSMPPQEAQSLFLKFVEILEEKVEVKTGVFGADMKVLIDNDGPVTFSLSF